MNPSRWIVLLHKSKKTALFIVSDFKAYLDYDMLVVMPEHTVGPLRKALFRGPVEPSHSGLQPIRAQCLTGLDSPPPSTTTSYGVASSTRKAASWVGFPESSEEVAQTHSQKKMGQWKKGESRSQGPNVLEDI
ncbi:ARF guanine-nucleotide exchange factor GNOM [Camellia lanceoleosa]|uniref:ARF guanine-nucleotide exchange factor GNOM n=1 Tax=Camellia lanceoleosa TaxID=1840588 RepID=A0ACC0FFS1_9ERIC|nr:ARF guanine-nucleotide exchange factor GNOM [Camellia lanceoleosa]